MKSHYLIAVILVAIGFGGGVAFHGWRAGCSNRYQIVGGGAAGNAFRHDRHTGDTWLITATGDETLVLPPAPQISFEAAKKMYETLKEAKVFERGHPSAGNNPPETLRDWAIQMNRLTSKDGRSSSGIYDAAVIKPGK